MADIDAMIADTNALIGRINIQPRPQQHGRPAPPPMARFPYYNADLNEQIHNPAEEQLVAQVLAMDYEQICNLRSEVDTKRALNPAYTTTREYVLKCKAGIWRVHLLKQAGQFGPGTSFGESVARFMGGWILADEFWKRNGF